MGLTVGTDEPLVSVIVPVYNGERYIDACVRSLLNQTHRHLEIILIDDSSTDSSGRICDSYAETDSRIKVIHKPNGGPSDARNAGIDIATGDYICFVDSDDLAMPAMVEQLLQICRQYEVKMAQGRSVITARTDELPEPPENPAVVIFDAEEAIAKTLYQDGIINSVWNTLYHRSIFDNLRFRKGTWYEDIDIFYRLLHTSGRVGVTDVPMYVYRQHPDSFIHRFDKRHADVLDVTDRMLKWIIRERPNLEEAARTRRLSAHINIFGLIAASGKQMPELRERCLNVIKADGDRCRQNPKAKRSLRLTMTLRHFIGMRMLERLLAIGYRRKEKRLIG